MRGAVVVASLLSQLSQQCGGALVRVRDEVSRSTPSDEWLPDAQSFSVCREASASHSALGQAPECSARRAGCNRRVVRAQTPGQAIKAPPRRCERNKYRS